MECLSPVRSHHSTCSRYRPVQNALPSAIPSLKTRSCPECSSWQPRRSGGLWVSSVSLPQRPSYLSSGQRFRTRRQALLQLLGLLGVLHDQGVQVALAADLELDLLRLGVLLDPGGYIVGKIESQISSPCLGYRSFCQFERTGSILPPADLDELWDYC